MNNRNKRREPQALTLQRFTFFNACFTHVFYKYFVRETQLFFIFISNALYVALQNRVPLEKNSRSHSSTKFTTLRTIPRDLFAEEIMAYGPLKKKKKKNTFEPKKYRLPVFGVSIECRG